MQMTGPVFNRSLIESDGDRDDEREELFFFSHADFLSQFALRAGVQSDWLWRGPFPSQIRYSKTPLERTPRRRNDLYNEMFYYVPAKFLSFRRIVNASKTKTTTTNLHVQRRKLEVSDGQFVALQRMLCSGVATPSTDVTKVRSAPALTAVLAMRLKSAPILEAVLLALLQESFDS